MRAIGANGEVMPAIGVNGEVMLTHRESATGPILPDVSVTLVGADGNAFMVLGLVRRAMRRAGYGDRVDEFTKDATSGDYDHLLATCLRWVNVR